MIVASSTESNDRPGMHRHPAISLRRVFCFVLILVVQTQKSTTTKVADPVDDASSLRE